MHHKSYYIFPLCFFALTVQSAGPAAENSIVRATTLARVLKVFLPIEGLVAHIMYYNDNLYLSEQYCYDEHKKQGESISFMRLSPDESTIASAGENHEQESACLRFHETALGQKIVYHQPLISPIHDLSWSPDAAYIAATSGTQVDICTLHPQKSLLPYLRTPTSIMGGTYYRYALIGRANQPEGPAPCIKLTRAKRIAGHQVSGNKPLIFTDGDTHIYPHQARFVAGSKKLVCFLSEPRIISVINLNQLSQEIEIQGVTAANLTNPIPVLGDINGYTYTIDPEDGTVSNPLLVWSSFAIDSVAASPTMIAASSGRHIALVSRAEKKISAKITRTGYHLPHNLQFMHDGQTLAYAAGETVTTVSAASGVPLQTLVHEYPVNSLVWDQGGNLFAATSRQILKYSLFKHEKFKEENDGE